MRTRGGVLVRNRVYPIHAFKVPKGCSAEWRRCRPEVQYVLKDAQSALNPRHTLRRTLETPLARLLDLSPAERRERVDALLRDLRGDLDHLVFISQGLAVVEQLCEDVVVMTDGRVVEEGRREAVFRSPKAAPTLPKRP